MTPHDVMLCLEGFKLQQKRDTDYANTMAYIQGRYFVDALLCTVGNMFSGKGAKKLEYPSEPYCLDDKEERELTEEEKEVQRKLLFANLMRMKENFESNKKGSNK